MSPDDLAAHVGAKKGIEILAYENDEDDLLVRVLFGYAKLSGLPVENLLDEDLNVGLLVFFFHLVWASSPLLEAAIQQAHHPFQASAIPSGSDATLPLQ